MKALKMPRIPLLRYSAAAVLEELEEGTAEVVRLKRGHAEVWNKYQQAVGYLTKASLEKLERMLKAQGRSKLLTRVLPLRNSPGTPRR